MMLSRAILLKLAGLDFDGGVNLSTSAVPSQLLPAKTTGVVADARGALTAGADEAPRTPSAHAATTARAAAATLRLTLRAAPLRLTNLAPPVTDGENGSGPGGAPVTRLWGCPPEPCR